MSSLAMFGNIAHKLQLSRFTFTFRSYSNRSKKNDAKNIVSAVNSVASSLKGDSQQIKSELIAKLKSHSVIGPQNTKEFDSKNILKGLSVESKSSNYLVEAKEKNQPSVVRSARPWTPAEAENENTARGKTSKQTTDRLVAKKSFRSSDKKSSVSLFNGLALDIFSPSNVSQKVADNSIIFEENKLSAFQLPQNSFEELIMLTSQGKVWHYPINNEQGMEEELKVPFYEHVFLEHLLDHGFPKKGPIRHFMELVCNGLQANPFMTVNEKHEHINWYRDYFKNKESLIKDIIVEK